MRPLIYSRETPSDIRQFEVGWTDLVRPIGEPTPLPFFLSFEKYCNRLPPDPWAFSFEYHADKEFDRLLSLVHGVDPATSTEAPTCEKT